MLKTEVVSQNKVRTVQDDKTGETREETYEVQMPVSKTIEVPGKVLKKDSPRINVDLRSVTAQRLDGAEIQREDLMKLLENPKRVFVLHEKARFYYSPDPFYTSVVNPIVKVLFVDDPSLKPTSAP